MLNLVPLCSLLMLNALLTVDAKNQQSLQYIREHTIKKYFPFEFKTISQEILVWV